MKRRQRRSELIGVGAGVAIAAALFGWMIAGRGLEGPSGALPVAAAVEPVLGLAGEHGKPVTLDTLGADYALVAFGFTHCPDTCPTTLARVAGALDRLGPLAVRVRPVMITLDPERDDPGDLRGYVDAFDPRIEALRGSPAATARVARAYRVDHRRRALEGGGYTLDHTSALFLVTPEGRCLDIYPAARPAAALAGDLRARLADG